MSMSTNKAPQKAINPLELKLQVVVSFPDTGAGNWIQVLCKGSKHF